MNDAKLLEAVRMLQDATKLLDAILVEQIGTHTVVTNQPDYDVSNVAPTFQFGDKVEVNGVGLKGTVTGLYGVDMYFVKIENDTEIYTGRLLVKLDPPKFDPNTADKSKVYFAVHPKYGEGIVWFTGESWWFESSEEADGDIGRCTHIDHKPIERRN
jgi:hypothetical protein